MAVYNKKRSIQDQNLVSIIHSQMSDKNNRQENKVFFRISSDTTNTVLLMDSFRCPCLGQQEKLLKKHKWW